MPKAVRRCRVCGCTGPRACPGGCSWVGPNLCSQCLHSMVPLSLDETVLLRGLLLALLYGEPQDLTLVEKAGPELLRALDNLLPNQPRKGKK